MAGLGGRHHRVGAKDQADVRGARRRAGPDFFEARGETTIRGPLYIHDIDSTKRKYIYINT